MTDEVIRRELTVPPELVGRRLDQAAAALIPEYSRSRLKQWIESGQLTLDGDSAIPRHKLRGGEALVLDAVLGPVVPVQPAAIALHVVYEDDSVLIVDKPPGLVVHPGAGNPDGTLQNALLYHDPALASLPRAGLVHRLDKNTSGLLVVARTSLAHQKLVAALAQREISRTYEAVCQSVLTGGGTVDAFIGRHPRDRLRMAVVEFGRSARTHYRVVERFRAHTHVRVMLETGRTHQIRVHMAHIDARVVGDPQYGGRPRLPSAPTDALRTLLQNFPRQALHATQLELAHPVSGEPLTASSALPEDIQELLTVLRADKAEHQAARAG